MAYVAVVDGVAAVVVAVVEPVFATAATALAGQLVELQAPFA